MKKVINKKEIIRIIKYLFSSGSSFVLDLALFTIFKIIMDNTIHFDTVKTIFIATFIARVLSSIYNYLINSRVVFQNKSKKGMVGYFTLVVVQMIVSAMLVSIIKQYIKVYETIIKFFIDIIIFIINYIIQKKLIFK